MPRAKGENFKDRAEVGLEGAALGEGTSPPLQGSGKKRCHPHVSFPFLKGILSFFKAFLRGGFLSFLKGNCRENVREL